MESEKKQDIILESTTISYANVTDADPAPSYIEHGDTAGPEPTDEEWAQLPEVSDAIPKAAFLVILIEFCERFTYYGLSGPFQNYIQNPNPASCKFFSFNKRIRILNKHAL